MYVTNIHIEGVGPVANASISPRFRSDGSPVPIVFVGQNGSGKTLTLSILLDAMIEAKKKVWTTIPEVLPEQYLRLMSQRYVRVGSEYSIAQIKFNLDDVGFAYNEVISRLDAEAFRTKFPNFSLEGREIVDKLREGTFFREFVPKGDIKLALGKTLMLYFPYFRYEQPDWLNAESKASLDLRQRLAGVTVESLIQVNVVDQICRWILDVVLDREIYERQLVPVTLQGGAKAQLFGGHVGPNASTIDLIQRLLLVIYSARDPTVTRVRLGINPKSNRQVAVFVQRGSSEEVCASPTLRQLSSGELMLLSLFCSIIRTHDVLHGSPAATPQEITGIVLIDEIDLHLHIALQKQVLPTIIKMFPNVQFIITTHSPFFLLGMADHGDDAADIYNLPVGAQTSPAGFSEFQNAYDIFVEKNEQFRQGYENLSSAVATATRPLVVTEGKTDWKHMKAALVRLKASGHYPLLDVTLLEYEDNIQMGDSQLERMCEHFAKAAHSRKVIFMFDRDNPQIVTKMAGDIGTGFKRWSEQVFSFCIPVPSHRTNHTNISIEHYYTDTELRTVDPQTGKRLFFTNEIEVFQRPGKGAKQVRILVQPEVKEESEKKIFDEDCTRIRDGSGTQVGHSKSVFAKHVLTNQAGFDQFGIDEFRGIWDAIERIIAAP